jgi:hypothetical protein
MTGRALYVALAVVIALSAFWLGSTQPAPPIVAQQDEQCFQETGKCIRGSFLRYWRANGGLRQQGLPISNEFDEQQPPPPAGDGRVHRVQYFERARFEHHQEFAGTENEVLLGLLGREQFQVRYPNGEPGAPPPPAPEKVLYQADWSQGFAGWNGPPDWKTVSGMLVNDGTAVGSRNIVAPYRPSTADYAIEIEMRVHGAPPGGGGLFAREGYYSGRWYNQITICATGECDAWQETRTDQEWHSYRLEARGNSLKLFVDGDPRLETTDNKYLAPGRVGLWANSAQISVRSFKIIQLQ